MKSYGEDLAYIHDVGHGDFARQAATALLEMLERHGIRSGLVVDLGCGSGIWAERLVRAGYSVLGIDLSPSMIALARKRVPEGEFREGSFLRVPLPRCAAVTSIGECFSYTFDRGNGMRGLSALFRRIGAALSPGGILIFDILTPGRVRGGGPQKNFKEGEDWAVMVSVVEDRRRRLLTRRITSFRKVGDGYRRASEVHEARLYRRSDMARLLRGAGFRARALAGYGDVRFARGQAGFLARKR